jgi:Methyltransferase domain
LFSPSFDGFTQEEWKTFVYNDGYLAVDPDYAGGRGQGFATMIAGAFRGAAGAHVIDYGCGKATFAAKLRELNWQNISNYDPFVPEFSQRPTEKAELVFACEVLEHSHHPAATFSEMASLKADPGVLIATTLLVPANADRSILDWWYVAPRNGHVTIHSQKSLTILASKAGLKMGSAQGMGLHFFWRQRPEWAAAVLPA